MKSNSEIICDTGLISRYIDNELDGNELVRLKAHIDGCVSCQARIDDYGKISIGLNSLVETQPDMPVRALEDNVVESIRKQNNAGLKDWKSAIFSRRMLVPMGVAASIILMFMTFFNNTSPVGPTAIVSSLSGGGSSVVIMETTETRQTIIWFSENG